MVLEDADVAQEDGDMALEDCDMAPEGAVRAKEQASPPHQLPAGRVKKPLKSGPFFNFFNKVHQDFSVQFVL